MCATWRNRQVSVHNCMKPKASDSIFDNALTSLVGSAMKVTKSKNEFYLPAAEYENPAALYVFWMSVKEDIQYIVWCLHK